MNTDILASGAAARRLLRLLSFLLLLLAATAAPGAEVHLKDGSLIIGTIEELLDGENLTVDTEHMDKVVIKWEAIERIEGTAQVNVELFSGRQLAGNLSLENDRLYVAAEDTGQVKEEIEAARVYEISQYTNRWIDGLDAALSLGLNLVRGNNQVTQLSYGGSLAYDGNRFDSGLDTTLIVNEQTDSENTRRFTLRGHHNQELSGTWTVGGIYQFESDDRQQLGSRSLLAGLVSHRVINNHRQRLRFSTGVAVNAEDFDTAASAESLEAVLGAVYRLRSSFGVDMDATFYALPSLSEDDRVRAQFDATLSADVLGDLDVRLTYYNRYDNQPPAAVSEFDWGLTLGLGYTF